MKSFYEGPTGFLISVGDPSKHNQKMGLERKSKMRDVVKLMIEMKSVMDLPTS